MNIQWFGLGQFSITGKLGGDEVGLVFDPFTDKFGIKPPRSLQADIIARSHEGKYADGGDYISASDDREVFEVHHAGEYESRSIFVHGVSAPVEGYDMHSLYKVFIEDISVAHLGVLNRLLKDKEVEALGDVDILIVPVGGDDVLSGKTAAEVVNQVEPRVVIPAYYHSDKLKTKHEGVESFVKELGVTPDKQKKYKVSKSGLPQEDMELIILEA